MFLHQHLEKHQERKYKMRPPKITPFTKIAGNKISKWFPQYFNLTWAGQKAFQGSGAGFKDA